MRPSSTRRSSTKNKAATRDPEMPQTKKGNDWYFGMKAHVGVDADSGVVHSLETTTAKAARQSGLGRAAARRGDLGLGRQGLCQRRTREAAQSAGTGKVWGVMRKAPKGGALHPIDAQINRIIAMRSGQGRDDFDDSVIADGARLLASLALSALQDGRAVRI